ncbi:hypothetical protein QUF70_04885 [Desulfobacterales bacterium HSG17]|nr:hypothetical protein [Desulfobacterales bacterium HSG17]
MTQPIVALWTHPRSISTAFERVMMERGDFNILHEPFSYLYYVHKQASAIDQEYKDPNHPTTYPEIKEHILKQGESSPVFFKDMCAHCFEELINDDELLSRLVNTFLIRHPDKAIPSFYAMNNQVKLDEIGYEQLIKVFQKSFDLNGNPPVVVDATDLEDNPEGIMKAYCKAINIKFIPEALSWDSGHKKEWDIWEKWHSDAAKSCGIQKNMEKFEVTIENSKHLKSYYDYHIEFYDNVYAHRIKAID